VPTRLGAAVFHIPARTNIYIDARGIDEAITIMRADLVVIRKALTTLFAAIEWIGIFTEFLSSLQAIRHHHTNPATCRPPHYSIIIITYMLLLRSINFLLEIRIHGFRTNLHIIWADIRANDLGDASDKLAVTHFGTNPPEQTLRVDIWEISMRPA
jgi:hypothetical protein